MIRTHLSRRRFLQTSGAAALVAATGPALESRQALAQNVDIEFLTFIGQDALERETAWFAEYGPTVGADVTVTSVSGSGFVLYVDKLKTSLAGGQPPDAARMWTGYLASPYVSFMAPLDDYYAQYGWDNILIPAAVEKTIIDGKKYGVPVSFNGMPFWYRVDVFEKAGITEPPATYAALEEANDRLKAAGYVPVSQGGKFGWNIMRVWEYLLEMHGGAQLHDDLIYMNTSWENQAVVDAFATWKKWVDNLWVNEGFLGMAPDDTDTMLTQGTAGMVLTGPWQENNIRAAEAPVELFGLFVPPTDQPTLRFSSFAEQWMVPTEGGNLDKTAELINAYIQVETQQALLAGSPATVGALDTANAPLGGKVFELLAANETFLVLDQAMPQEITNAFFAEQASVSSGSTSPEDAATAMQKAIEDYKANL
jgi:raffinose/stachyose/melibiose transport system substrate-binding protein